MNPTTESQIDDLSLYRNPIINADWPDPDVIRVGEDYYLVASSFNRAPGLPVLHSRDLVNWTLLTYALAAVEPQEHYRLPRHGTGVWAPSIRFHNGLFHIVFPDPDRGIFVVSATEPSGPWSEPRALLEGLGLIDPCPLWDEDGSTYLVHGWAASRSGIKNKLTVIPVDAGLTHTTGPGVAVIDGGKLAGYTTLEGPKFYRRDGWYWIFAPAGGVADGWQSVFRSRTVYGPYEDRIVMRQGRSGTNGPHQGAWVDTPDGSEWFFHFQDRGPIGRVVHLQPLSWTDDNWPVIGTPTAGSEWGTPVDSHPMPLGGVQGPRTLARGDDFSGGLGSQWYWQANPDPRWAEVDGAGHLVLQAVANDTGSLRSLPQVLAQQVPGLRSRITTTLSLAGPVGTRAGLVVLGRDYLWVGLRLGADGSHIEVASKTRESFDETVLFSRETTPAKSVQVRLDINEWAIATVSLRADGDDWTALPEQFPVSEGQWIGAEIGLFATAPFGSPTPGSALFGAVDIDVFDQQ